MIKKAAVLALLTIRFAALEAQAQEADSLKQDIKTLEEHTVTGHYHSKTPVSRTLDMLYLKKETLLQSQGNTFINTLEKLPGISAINTGVGIAKPVIRGLSLNRVIVNEYGIKQEGQQWGVDHGLEIDQYNVDRVEVIKGPVSVLYGSDGIGGVINILPPIVPMEDTINAEIISTYKSNNDLLGLSGKVQYSKKGFYAIARGTYQNYASYRVPAREFVYNGYTLPIYNNRLKNTGGDELNFSLLAGVKRSWGSSSIYVSNYRQKAGFFVGAFGVPRAYQLNDEGNYRQVALPYQTIDHTKVISNTILQLPKGKIEADFGFQKNARSEQSPPHAHGYGPAPQGNEALALDLYTLSGNVRYSYSLGKWNTITGTSFQYQQNVRGGYEFLIPSYTSWQTGLYHFSEYQPRFNLLFNAGIRADYAKQNAAASFVTRYDSTGARTGTELRSPEIDRDHFNVSGSLGSAWQINHIFNAKFNLGTAFRIPVMAELTANGVHHGTFRHEMGDAGLNAERGYMADLGVTAEWKDITFQVTPFVNYFANYIYLSPSARFSPLPDAGQIYLYRGAPALFTGLELNKDWTFHSNWSNTLSLEYVRNKNLETGLPLPFTPPLSVLEEISWRPKFKRRQFYNTMFAVNGQYFAAQRRVDRNEPSTDGYMLLNFSASNTFRISRQKLTLFLQLRNMTNTVYKNNMSRYRILNLPEQGFNTQVMLRWEL